MQVGLNLFQKLHLVNSVRYRVDCIKKKRDKWAAKEDMRATRKGLKRFKHTSRIHFEGLIFRFRLDFQPLSPALCNILFEGSYTSPQPHLQPFLSNFALITAASMTLSYISNRVFSLPSDICRYLKCNALSHQTCLLIPWKVTWSEQPTHYITFYKTERKEEMSAK